MAVLTSSRFLKAYEALNDGLYLFNSTKFKPIRIEGSLDEARAFVQKIQNNQLDILDSRAKRLLRSHHILLPMNEVELDPRQSKNANDDSAGLYPGFTIRMSTRITDHKAVLRALERVAEDAFKKENSKFKRLDLKFITDTLLTKSLYDLLVPIMRFVWQTFPLEKDKIVFYCDVPAEYTANHVEQIRFFILPNLRLNLHHVGDLTEDTLNKLNTLVDRGFCPNFVFHVVRPEISKIPENLAKLKTRWKRDFFYSLFVPLREVAEVGSSYKVRLPSTDQIDNLMRYIVSMDAPDVDLFTTYIMMKSNLADYPKELQCRAQRGRAVYIDGKGEYGSCFRSAKHDPMAIRKPDERNVVDLCKWMSTGKEMYSVCTACPLIHLCGGECDVLTGDIGNNPGGEEAFGLRCRIRRATIEIVLRETTQPEDQEEFIRRARSWRFVSGNRAVDLESKYSGTTERRSADAGLL